MFTTIPPQAVMVAMAAHMHQGWVAPESVGAYTTLSILRSPLAPSVPTRLVLAPTAPAREGKESMALALAAAFAPSPDPCRSTYRPSPITPPMATAAELIITRQIGRAHV